MPVRVLTVRGGADTPAREGPMPSRVTVGAIGPILGWATGRSALRARAGRLKGPHKTVTAAMAFLEGVTNQGVAAIPRVPWPTDIVRPVGVVSLVVVAAEVADGAAPPSPLTGRRAAAPTAAAPGGRGPTETPTAADAVGRATAARTRSSGLP